ncbi:MAG: hypothetical protein LBI42_12645 [Chitinispirillales bacterium]|nr:hypothetical protein [Chitinispirillales bacterium]
MGGGLEGGVGGNRSGVFELMYNDLNLFFSYFTSFFTKTNAILNDICIALFFQFSCVHVFIYLPERVFVNFTENANANNKRIRHSLEEAKVQQALLGMDLYNRSNVNALKKQQMLQLF